MFQLDYDPDVITYRELLGKFWESHDPWRPARSRQYMPVVLYHDGSQEERVRGTVSVLEEGRGESVETRIDPLDTFYRAEDYHQKHKLRRQGSLMGAFSHYSSREFTDSTAAARLNGLVAGYRRSGEDRLDLEALGLPREVHRSAASLLR